ncbi:MAG: DUF805 domain-containing protein [Bacteriovoracia bacterium]
MNEMHLREKNGLFQIDGVIGRLIYLRNILIIIGLSMVVTYLLGGYETPNPAERMGIPGVIAFTVLTYLLLINSFKRLKDIRGTNKNQLLYNLGLAFIFFIPYVSLFALLALLFAKGTVTSQKGVNKIEVIPTPENETQKTDYYSRIPPVEDERRESL